MTDSTQTDAADLVEPILITAADGRDDAVTAAYVFANQVTYSWHRSMLELVGADAVGSQRLIRGGFIAMHCGTDGLPEARNTAVKTFLADDRSDWLWWIDTDMGFAPDTIDQLMDAADPVERPFVGALCFAQHEDRADDMGGFHCSATPTIFDWVNIGGQKGWKIRHNFATDTITRVGGTGAACVLIHRSVFEAIEAAHGRTWYDRIPNTTTGQLISEDLSFCLRAGALDIPMYVHTGVPTTHLKPVWLGEEEYWRQRALISAAEAFTAQDQAPGATEVIL